MPKGHAHMRYPAVNWKPEGDICAGNRFEIHQHIRNDQAPCTEEVQSPKKTVGCEKINVMVFWEAPLFKRWAEKRNTKETSEMKGSRDDKKARRVWFQDS